MQQFSSLLSWRLFTAQHVSDVSPAHHQELNDCGSSLWFYLRIVVIAMLCSWSGLPAIYLNCTMMHGLTNLKCIGVLFFFAHTFLWISISLRTRKHQNTIYQLISLTNYSVIHRLYRKFKAEQTFKYCPLLEKATVRCLFLKDYQWTLCWAISIHSTSPHFAYLRSSLMLLPHLV
jgi:hypothetical protein